MNYAKIMSMELATLIFLSNKIHGGYFQLGVSLGNVSSVDHLMLMSFLVVLFLNVWCGAIEIVLW